jgi:predicted PurR-regulated permease PerM
MQAHDMSDDLPARATGPRRLRAPTPRVALVIAAAIVVGIVLYLGRHALTPFVVGALIVYVLDPPVGWLARLRVAGRTMPRGLAVLIVYLASFVAVVEGLALLLGPLVRQLIEFLGDLPRLTAALEDALARLGETYRSLELPPTIREFLDEALADLADGPGGFDLGALLPIAQSILGTAASFFGFLIIPIWAFYILRDRVRLTNRLKEALPRAWHDDAWAVLSIIERTFGRWIRAQIVLGLIIGVATYGGLLLLGWFVDPRFLQFALLLAVIAAILELLPIIGPIIAMLPTLLIALTASEPVTAVIAVLVLYIVVQQFEGAVLVPKIQGDALSLHPSVVIFVLIVGAAIAGLPGAILSIPVTAAASSVYAYLFRRLSDDEPAPPADDSRSGDDEPTGDDPAEPGDPSNPAGGPAISTDRSIPERVDEPADIPPPSEANQGRARSWALVHSLSRSR